jgi:hypothetical protein
VAKSLVAWYQPWWEYLQDGNEQTAHIRALFFCRAGFLALPAHERRSWNGTWQGWPFGWDTFVLAHRLRAAAWSSLLCSVFRGSSALRDQRFYQVDSIHFTPFQETVGMKRTRWLKTIINFRPTFSFLRVVSGSWTLVLYSHVGWAWACAGPRGHLCKLFGQNHALLNFLLLVFSPPTSPFILIYVSWRFKGLSTALSAPQISVGMILALSVILVWMNLVYNLPSFLS